MSMLDWMDRDALLDRVKAHQARIAELEAAIAKVVDALEEMSEDRQQTDELSEKVGEALAAAREVSK